MDTPQALTGQRRDHGDAESEDAADVTAHVHGWTALLEPFYRRYETVAVRIGLAGNALFVVGSVVFLFGPSLPATLCWLLGSLGMLVRAVGRLYADERAAYDRNHGHDGGEAMAAARRQLDTSPE